MDLSLNRFNGGVRGTSLEVGQGSRSVGIKGLIRQQRSEWDPPDPWCDACEIVSLAGQEQEAHEVPKCIYESNDFGRQATARAPDGLTQSPPFAPVAFWRTEMIVPSINAYSKSGSSDIALKRLSNTPASAQRRNRRNVEQGVRQSVC